MFRNGLEPWHIVVLVVVIALLFGWKKMPDMARSFGRSARILRSEIGEMKSDKKNEATGHGAHRQAPPAGAAQNATPATPAPSAAGVQDNVSTQDPVGHHTTT